MVGGIRIGGSVEPGAVAELRAALLRHKVVFLRDQQHATDADQRAFAQLLGPLTRPHPTVAGDGTAVLPIDSEQGKANSWHTDVTFVDRVPAISVLRAITLPPYGGTTVWANTAEAYRRLHPALQALAGQLRAVHSNLYDYAADRRSWRRGSRQSKRSTSRGVRIWSSRPSTRWSGSTRRPMSPPCCSATSCAPRGLSTPTPPTCSPCCNGTSPGWRTRCAGRGGPGDIAIWDNRATQHYAVADYDDLPRLLHRVTIAGDIPVGINGDTSVVRKGDASHYAPLAA